MLSDTMQAGGIVGLMWVPAAAVAAAGPLCICNVSHVEIPSQQPNAAKGVINSETEQRPAGKVACLVGVPHLHCTLLCRQHKQRVPKMSLGDDLLPSPISQSPGSNIPSVTSGRDRHPPLPSHHRHKHNKNQAPALTPYIHVHATLALLPKADLASRTSHAPTPVQSCCKASSPDGRLAASPM